MSLSETEKPTTESICDSSSYEVYLKESDPEDEQAEYLTYIEKLNPNDKIFLIV